MRAPGALRLSNHAVRAKPGRWVSGTHSPKYCWVPENISAGCSRSRPVLASSLRPEVVHVQLGLMVGRSAQAWALAAATLGPRDVSSTKHALRVTLVVCNSLRPVADLRKRFVGACMQGASQCALGHCGVAPGSQ